MVKLHCAVTLNKEALKECSGETVKQTSKLAAEAELIDGQLIRLFSEPEDSGIDSDDTSRARRAEHQNEDSSSSDEDQMIRPWWAAQKTKNDESLNDGSGSDEDQLNRRWWQSSKNHENLKTMKNGQVDPIDIATWPGTKSLESLDRSSPPLYEVELTASDEDDDASVLELVIPMQSSRYQRVPTSSPKKAKPKSHRFLYVFCCLRK